VFFFVSCQMAKAFRQFSVHLSILLTCFIVALLQNAFRRKAMEYHPDQNQNNKGEHSFLVSPGLLSPSCKVNI
jgi:hypothetical protein